MVEAELNGSGASDGADLTAKYDSGSVAVEDELAKMKAEMSLS